MSSAEHPIDLSSLVSFESESRWSAVIVSKVLADYSENRLRVYQAARPGAGRALGDRPPGTGIGAAVRTRLAWLHDSLRHRTGIEYSLHGSTGLGAPARPVAGDGRGA